MRTWLAILALALGLALAVMPIGHALAAQDHAAHTQLDHKVDKATAALIAICCPAANLPAAAATIAHPVVISPVAWSGLREIAPNGQRLAPEPPPPRL